MGTPFQLPHSSRGLSVSSVTPSQSSIWQTTLRMVFSSNALRNILRGPVVPSPEKLVGRHRAIDVARSEDGPDGDPFRPFA